MTLLISILFVCLNFTIAELIHKKITGRYFEFGYGTRDRHDFLMTLIVVVISLGSAPFLSEWLN